MLPDDFPEGCKVVFYDFECGDYHTAIAHSHSDFVRLFSQQYGQYPVDAVWTERTVAGTIWQRMLSKQRDKLPIPVTICEPEVEDVKQISQETDEMLRSLSAASCKYVLLGQDQLRLAVERYRKYLSGSMLRRMQQNARVLYLGGNINTLDRVLQSSQKAEEFTVMYGGWVIGRKRVDQIVEIMKLFHEMGRSVQNVITTPPQGSKILTRVLSGADQIDFRMGVDRDQYWKTAAQAHVFLCASEEESEPVGFLEGLFLTGIGLSLGST